MMPVWQRALRGLVIAGGGGVLIASLLAFEWARWPVYLTYCSKVIPLANRSGVTICAGMPAILPQAPPPDSSHARQ